MIIVRALSMIKTSTDKYRNKIPHSLPEIRTKGVLSGTVHPLKKAQSIWLEKCRPKVSVKNTNTENSLNPILSSM